MSDISIYKITNNTELLKLLDEVAAATDFYFEADNRSISALKFFVVSLEADLYFNERVCEVIASKFKYFRGIFNGNGHSITVYAERSFGLFSSIYGGKFINLHIKTSNRSRAMWLAEDACDTTVDHVELNGEVILTESSGGIFKTSQRIKWKDCFVDIKIQELVINDLEDPSEFEPLYFGGYSGSDIDSTFENCVVTGSIMGEVKVGGFVAVSKDTTFNSCNIVDLEVNGKREVGLFVGDSRGVVEFNDCEIFSSKCVANIYTGYYVGRSKGKVVVNRCSTDSSFITSNSTASFVGGVVGSTIELEVSDSKFDGGITGNFVVAGICPDARDAKLYNNHFSLIVTAIGYRAMMTHAYETVRNLFTTTDGEEITIVEEGTSGEITLTELSVTGLINPFKESLL